MYYEINEGLARSSRAMWSMWDYKEGSATAGYKLQVDEAYELVESLPDEFKEKGLYYADKYAKKLAENINKGFRIDLMCPSILISGGSNFPVRKKEKQNAARDRQMEEYHRLEYYLDRIKSAGMGTDIIKSGDQDVTQQLQAKIDRLQSLQDKMKAANAHYRKCKTMVGFGELSKEDAEKLDECIKTDSWQERPHPSYELTNNNAKIKAAKARLARIQSTKEKGTIQIENENFKIVENTEIMRLQLLFDGKPDPGIRTLLKTNGFKWAPSQGAWQRQLTNNARYALQRVVEEMDKMSA